MSTTGEEEQEEQGWLDSATEWVSETADAVVDTAGDAVEWVADTATETAEAVVDTAGAAVDWVADTTGDAVEWAVDTAEETVEWVSDTVTEWVSDDEQAAPEPTAPAAPAEPAGDPIEEERVAQDVALAKDHLVQGLSAAKGTATTLQASWPDVDTAGASSLSATLKDLADYAASAGFRAGKVQPAAKSAFYTARDEASWASKQAAVAGDKSFSAEWKSVLDELPGLIGGALGAVNGI